MRKIYYYIFLISLIVASLSCSEFLDDTPESTLTPKNVFDDEQSAIAVLNGVYNQFTLLYKGKEGFINFTGTDEALQFDQEITFNDKGIAYFDTYGSGLSSENFFIGQLWNKLWPAVAQSNAVIDNVGEGKIKESLKLRLDGEARFLRSLSYFMLTQWWGDVPLITSSNLDPKNTSFPRVADSVIYNQIISDLKIAATNLPERYTGEDLGRATSGAAKTLLAKVYMYASVKSGIRSYQKAADVLKEIIDSEVYSLLDDYSHLFDEAHENNQESIFEIQYDWDADPNLYNTMAYFTGSRCMLENPPVTPGLGWELSLPTDFCANAFEPSDKRRNVSIRFDFYKANGDLITPANAAFNDFASVLKPHIKKFEIQKGHPHFFFSSKNIYVLRYSDVLLMYGECLNELNRTSEAIPYLNLVRRRAGVYEYEDLSKSEYRIVNLNERMLELCFEGWRRWDLIRTGNFVNYIKARNPWAGAVQAHQQVFPIPLNEILNNEGIDFDDQNPGYI